MKSRDDINDIMQGRRKQIESGGPISGESAGKIFLGPHFSFGPPF